MRQGYTSTTYWRTLDDVTNAKLLLQHILGAISFLIVRVPTS